VYTSVVRQDKGPPAGNVDQSILVLQARCLGGEFDVIEGGVFGATVAALDAQRIVPVTKQELQVQLLSWTTLFGCKKSL